jgi:hypothetical protein
MTYADVLEDKLLLKILVKYGTELEEQEISCKFRWYIIHIRLYSTPVFLPNFLQNFLFASKKKKKVNSWGYFEGVLGNIDDLRALMFKLNLTSKSLLRKK